MGFHTFDAEQAARLEDAAERYRYCSREELLGMLAPDPAAVVADLGSGTGFYADDVAPHVGTLHAVDVQPAMHDYYRQKSARDERAERGATEPGLPANVDLVAADVGDLPFADDALDGAYGTMTFHEFADDASVAELARVCRPGARLALVDWSAAGAGETGPPLSERYEADDAAAMLAGAGFDVDRADERVETLAVTATR
ncbi:ubiquinone/menaquinone biosynthesis C-methylase UbiE [Halarchaeum rubridurum]|uniref:SAM-dependent methyltransferase n=1 Tax=Halarchaeum rubridurum TaxID=489911 RepID=A0A830FYV0_9EURY|nr:class I SAM-dependent methyltransferase [Halarchaeum rubridurum]MBP1954564.1 ubiquinone/menaquinone biosynthesis C-methylase UbiE [Halarchaeum rubridurum]GGM62073.1 SAM-dependent methyltransferase [Halarchaeum rubridurum]